MGSKTALSVEFVSVWDEKNWLKKIGHCLIASVSSSSFRSLELGFKMVTQQLFKGDERRQN
jgi:hypothetical protein